VQVDETRHAKQTFNLKTYGSIYSRSATNARARYQPHRGGPDSGGGGGPGGGGFETGLMEVLDEPYAEDEGAISGPNALPVEVEKQIEVDAGQ